VAREREGGREDELWGVHGQTPLLLKRPIVEICHAPLDGENDIKGILEYEGAMQIRT
jgi:hypothetical protein